VPVRSGVVAWRMYDGYLLHVVCQRNVRQLGYDIPPLPYPLDQPILEAHQKGCYQATAFHTDSTAP